MKLNDVSMSELWDYGFFSRLSGIYLRWDPVLKYEIDFVTL